ncbi:hypothetical protein ARMGADRAFT_1086904 [Armillaria gallica]|uniref:Uncharacterized protein n=1 Tax=Armillaria gallica TaxID=47427 RepID=A0A2H3CWG1_ARMGA|nr:hypothetical protein ARMGADRAFT_1086904 [Armillaria gallica]
MANPLPHDSPAIMIAETEFSIEGYSNNVESLTIDRVGEITPGLSDPHEPYVHDNLPTVEHNRDLNSLGYNQAPIIPGDTGISHNSIKVEAAESTTHNYNECQPTSSRVLIEDLVTDEDDTDSDSQGLAWPGFEGLGSAWAGSGF